MEKSRQVYVRDQEIGLRFRAEWGAFAKPPLDGFIWIRPLALFGP